LRVRRAIEPARCFQKGTAQLMSFSTPEQTIAPTIPYDAGIVGASGSHRLPFRNPGWNRDG